MADSAGPTPRMGDRAMATGRLPTELANAISDAISAALAKGMEPDEAACITVAVAADYSRGYYGDDYLPHLARAVTARHGMALPEEE